MKAYNDLIKKISKLNFRYLTIYQIFGMILTKIHVFFFKNNHFFQNIMCIFIQKKKEKKVIFQQKHELDSQILRYLLSNK